ncbi:apical endosomal glycoprotein [Emydura macquarii macquarii]|uniref:apical endosomal glycoprotein n=1 Tax=Emydura macquarii macquarii TaxID=1129001 RepID=UPI00352B9B25
MSATLFLLVLGLSAWPHPGIQSIFINRCGRPAQQVCDFTCDCRDCSDENQCGYHKESAVLGTPFTCDFEEGSCGWKDVSTSTYRWVPERAGVATWGPGPSTDHTRGTDLGWYMAAETPRNTSAAIARLRSPVMRQAAATCEIHAWYHLWGEGLSESERPGLWVELTRDNETLALWQSPEGSGHAWRELVAYTGRVPGEFQISLCSRPSSVLQGAVAVDDVEFRNCGLLPSLSLACGPEERPCSHGSCVQLEQLCDGTDDCGDLSDESAPECGSFSICSFEEGWCGWDAAPDCLTWVRNTSLHLTPGARRPTRDHSSNSRTGFFLYASSSPEDVCSGAARLTSPTFQAPTANCSLVFYSHLSGSAASSLNVYCRTQAGTQLLRARAGDRGDYWFREKVDFNVTENFQILLEGVLSRGHRGGIALDDLVLSPGCVRAAGNQSFPPSPPSPAPTTPCTPEEFACDNTKCISAELACDFTETCGDGSDEKHCGASTFEGGAGGWQDASVGQLQWAREKASAALLPGTDHNSALAAGSYLSVQPAAGQMVSVARARTPPLGPSGLACSLEMRYWLHSDPQGFIALSIVDRGLGTRKLAWHMQGNASTEWKHIAVPLGERPRAFQVELTALVNVRGRGQGAAVDDVAFVNCEPRFTPQYASELACNFETGLCGWYQDQRADLEWVRGPGLGLGSDHTTGTGYFLSVDLSAQRAWGLGARLVTYPQDPPTREQCLSFWYRLHGPQIGTLNLKIQHDGEPETVLWTTTGAHGSMWHLGFTTLRRQALQRYRLVFEALRDGYLGEMALDDITVRAGACGPQESCSFEANTCGFSSHGQYTWARQSNATGTAAAGPPADHTVGTARGHYMIVDTSKGSLPRGQAATLSSGPYRPLTHPQCLVFWYQLSSSDPGSLNVHVEETGVRRRLLSVSSVPEAGWRYGRVTVQAAEDWQVVFEVLGAGGELSYIALDDLHLKDSSCPEPGACDFELDTCGWTSPADPNWGSYAWGWRSGASPSRSPGPEVDHTLGTAAGHYTYFDTSVLGAGGNTAWLLSEHLPATTGACLRFWYHMDFTEHFSSGELRVKLYSMAGQLTVWSTRGHQGRGWQSRSVPVQSAVEFQIVFEVSRGAWPAGAPIAVDDIAYSAGEGCDGDQRGQGEDGRAAKGSVAAVVTGVLLAALLLLLAAGGTGYWLKKRVSGSLPEASATSQGFDNIAFSDDRVTITPSPEDGAAEQL